MSSARRSIQEDRLSLEAIIDGSDMKQAVLSEEYIQYIVKQSSDEAGKPKTLGEGFFGVVFEGKDPELHSTFAVKTIRTYVIDGGNEQHLETARETFQKEQKVTIIFQLMIMLLSYIRLLRPEPYVCLLNCCSPACAGSFYVSTSKYCAVVGLFISCRWQVQLLFGL